MVEIIRHIKIFKNVLKKKKTNLKTKYQLINTITMNTFMVCFLNSGHLYFM